MQKLAERECNSDLLPDSDNADVGSSIYLASILDAGYNLFTELYKILALSGQVIS